MTLKSDILAGNPRLELAASGGPSVKIGEHDADAVKRIQTALAALGFAMRVSFPDGPSGEPDGIYGQETSQTVNAFQRREFPKKPGEWDGRAGRNTLGRMDELLGSSDDQSVTVPANELAISHCRMRLPTDFA
jgi:peptidoglycan hydrolase-like protein with peptidoglycan-binding domain